MNRLRSFAAAAALACALAAAGCGVGAGDESGSAGLLVTRDYGTAVVTEVEEQGISESETVLRLLEGNSEITTRYGGRFVQSIDGTEATTSAGRRFDWFFYVNGVESPVGAADVKVEDGERVWWDYRDWTDAMRVPAVVGSWPEPFLHGFEGTSYRTRIDCLGAMDPCKLARQALAEEGVEAGIFEDDSAPGFDAESEPTLRVLVGPWSTVGEDRAAALIDEGQGQSGVFARFEGSGPGPRLVGLGRKGEEVLTLGRGSGLVAAVRFEEQPPTWVVTGTDPAGVKAAAEAFAEAQLSHRYAVIVGPNGQVAPVPVAVDR